MSPRRFEVDLVKAVCIVAVVLIHSMRPHFSPEASRAELRLLDVTRFAVPGFLAASGYLHATPGRISWAITRGRLGRLIGPYLVASVGAQVFRFAFQGEGSPERVVEDILLASSFGPFYYVPQAILCVLAAPVISGLRPRSFRAVTAAGILAQWVCWAFVTLPLFWAIRNPLHWMGFYLVGWSLRTREPALSRWLARHRLTAFVLSAAGVATTSMLATTTTITSVSGTMLWLCVWCALLAILTAGAQRQARGVRLLSDSSYTIYLFHLFFVYPTQRLLTPAAGVFDSVAIAAAWLAGIVGPLTLAAAGRAVLPRSSRTLLGS